MKAALSTFRTAPLRSAATHSAARTRTHSAARTRTRTAAALIAAMLLAATMPGCSRAHRADPDLAASLSRLEYPADGPRGESLDIIVRRDGNHLELNNRTARAYPRAAVWLNQQWVGHLEGIPIGQSAASLDNFVNRYGESYPVGALLTPEEALPLVAVEMIDPASGRRRSLTVDVDQD